MLSSPTLVNRTASSEASGSRSLRLNVGEAASGSGQAELQAYLSAMDAYAKELEGFIGQLRERAKRNINDGQHDELMRLSASLRSVADAELKTENPLLLALRGFKGRRRRGGSRLREALLYMHYRLVRKRADARTVVSIIQSGFFDKTFYLEKNRDVAKAGLDPVTHFLDYGAKELRNPSRSFDVSFYLKTYPDVDLERENPLAHFLRFGMSDGYAPLPSEDVLSERHWKLPKRPAAIAKRPPESKVSLLEAESELRPGKPRIVVYTAVSGGYDQLSPPKIDLPGVDFVAFRDDLEEIPGWTVRPFNYSHKDPTRTARFAKLHPHLYFSDYDISVWVDGNILIKGDLRELIAKVGEDDTVGIFHHPLRNCVYVEGKECIKRSKDSTEDIELQLERYRIEGYPTAAGLWETNVVVRRHNDPRCKALMRQWWKEIEVGSRRDQLSLPVAAHKTGVEIVPLGRRRENARDHKIVGLVEHPPRKVTARSVSPIHTQKPIDVRAKSVVIGICVHNALPDVKECLNSLLISSGHDMRAVIIDDASNDETAEHLKAFAKKHSFVKLIRNDVNKGYTNSANQVLANGGDDWTVVLNSDTILGKKSISRLIAAGEQFEQIGVIGPLSNAASWQSVPRLTGDDGKFCVNRIPEGMTVDDIGELVAGAGQNEVAFVPLVNGFCFAVRKAAIDAVVSFDEENFPMGYGEEDDFCLRVGDQGFHCALALNAYVYHAKSATFTAERRGPLVAQGAEALRRIHGENRLKAAVQFLRHHPRLSRVRDDVAEQQERHLAALAQSNLLMRKQMPVIAKRAEEASVLLPN